MRTRKVLLTVLAVGWTIAVAVVGIATLSLVAESGWSELPAFAWLLLAVLFGICLPGLCMGAYRWVINPAGA